MIDVAGLLRAYRSISFDMGPGHEGGRLYEGRSGNRAVIFGRETAVIPAGTTK
jgi:hypothetical protein